MAIEPKLAQALQARVSGVLKAAPVFHIVQRPLETLEQEALELGRRFSSTFGEAGTRAQVRRGTQSTVAMFPHGITVKLFHASGAVIARRALEPAAHLFKQPPAKDTLVSRALDALGRVGVGETAAAGERLDFERLWQIKAAGRRSDGQQGYEVLCRAVGTFRRFVHDLPVLGRASVFVKLAADNVIEAVGRDWRPCEERAFDEAPVIDPAEAASRVAAELALASGNSHVSAEHYEPEFFGLGYLSFPKRRVQSVLQPVYVAVLRARGWTTLGRIVVVPASDRAYEPIARQLQAPPRAVTAKPAAR